MKAFSLLKKICRRVLLDSDERHFARHQAEYSKRLLKNTKQDKRRILIDFFDSNLVVYSSGLTARYLASKLNASIDGFLFARGWAGRLGIPSRRIEKLYGAFGARPRLSFKEGERFSKEAQEYADQTFSSLKNKWDVVNLSIDGVKIGDLVYDTYLRAGRWTVDLADPRLKEILCDAFLIFKLCREYFRNHDVCAVITSHCVYISHGILVRVASTFRVPVFFVMDPYKFQVVEVREDNNHYHFYYHRYKELFARFNEVEKQKHRDEARKVLLERLSGKIDSGIADILEDGRPGLHGYGAFSEGRLLKETGRPRVIVMLNCFLDAPHCYRDMLFPDFWEWINFVLSRASQTSFDWYVKPHPGGLPQNDLVLEELKRKYPKVNFLGRSASNRQIAAEGIDAMFTVFGTAAHEFAYMGIPVVTAGDNPHVNYGFNFHPRTVEEYEKFIANAGHLKIEIDKAEIEEFFYMHYIDAHRPNPFGAICVDDSLSSQVVGARVNHPSILKDYVRTETQEKLQKLEAYLGDFFGNYFPQIKNEPG
ncbi:MAG: hypothetical protein AB1540_01060 [Bdellovibrionota bacterium]